MMGRNCDSPNAGERSAFCLRGSPREFFSIRRLPVPPLSSLLDVPLEYRGLIRLDCQLPDRPNREDLHGLRLIELQFLALWSYRKWVILFAVPPHQLDVNCTIAAVCGKGDDVDVQLRTNWPLQLGYSY